MYSFDTLERNPEIVTNFKVTKTSMKIGNPWGGLIYVTVSILTFFVMSQLLYPTNMIKNEKLASLWNSTQAEILVCSRAVHIIKIIFFTYFRYVKFNFLLNLFHKC